MTDLKTIKVGPLARMSSKDEAPWSGRHVHPEEAMLLGAVSRALEWAGSGPGTDADLGSTGIVVGVDGPLDTWKGDYFTSVVDEGPLGASPLLFPYTSANALAARASIEFGLRGQSLTITSGPLSFVKALASAAALVTDGAASTVVACGVGTGEAAAAVVSRSVVGMTLSVLEEAFTGENDGATALTIEETFAAVEAALAPGAPGGTAGGPDGPGGEVELDLTDPSGSCVRLRLGRAREVDEGEACGL